MHERINASVAAKLVNEFQHTNTHTQTKPPAKKKKRHRHREHDLNASEHSLQAKIQEKKKKPHHLCSEKSCRISSSTWLNCSSFNEIRASTYKIATIIATMRVRRGYGGPKTGRNRDGKQKKKQKETKLLMSGDVYS